MDKKRLYFMKQKLLGVGMILSGIVTTIVAKELTWTVLALPVGILLLRSKDMIFVNDYYFEVKEQESKGL